MLPFADYAINMARGKIVETGLASAIVQSLELQTRFHDQAESDSSYIQEATPETTPNPSNPNTETEAEEASENPEKLDKRRQNGDWSVYWYYLSNSGLPAVALYALVVIAWMFCAEFSSKNSSLQTEMKLYLTT